MVIKKSEYERLKRTSNQTIDNYTYLLNNTDGKIKNMADKIHDLSEDIKTTLEKLHLVETARRINAGKLGGLTKALNKEKEKNEALLNTVNELEDTIELQQLESEKKDTQIKILKNVGKQKQMEDYKKLEELTKDINKHKKVK